MAGRKRKADASLVLALACGASPENAAQRTGLSLRTVYRRLAEPAFCAQVMDLRVEMTRRLAGMLTAAGVGSVKTFTTLQDSAASEAVRLVLRWAFGEARYQKCDVTIYEFNEASVAFHRHLGFAEEGRRRRAVYTAGGFYDELLFGITAEEFWAGEGQ